MWSAILGCGVASLDSTLAEFRVHRTMIEHPPVPATVVVRWGLPGDS